MTSTQALASSSRTFRSLLPPRRGRNSVALAGYPGQPVTMIDPAIESHYGTGYERSRLFPGGRPSLEFVRSMGLPSLRGEWQ